MRILNIFMILLMVSCSSGPKKYTIGYIQITEDPVLDTARAGLFRALADSGYIDGENIKVIENNAQGDLSMLNTILQSFISRNVDMVITNSTPCMIAAAQSVQNVPVVFTVAFGPEQVGMQAVPSNLHGVYDPLKASEFTDILVKCIPGIKRIGIPYNNAEPNAAYSVKILSAELMSRGITVLTAPVTGTNEILQAALSLSLKNIDAFLAAADNTVYLGLPMLAKVADEKKIPLFVTDPLQTEKGASLGYGVDYHQWGYQSGLKAVDIMKNRMNNKPNIEAITRYDLAINPEACKRQGLAIPEEIAAGKPE